MEVEANPLLFGIKFTFLHSVSFIIADTRMDIAIFKFSRRLYSLVGPTLQNNEGIGEMHAWMYHMFLEQETLNPTDTDCSEIPEEVYQKLQKQHDKMQPNGWKSEALQLSILLNKLMISTYKNFL